MSKELMTPREELVESIDPYIKLTDIEDKHKREVTAVLLENQRQQYSTDLTSLREDINMTPQVQNWQNVMLQMARRITPKLIAFDLAGVQPMNMPDSVAFALHARYPDGSTPIDFTKGKEALFQEVDTAHSGKGTSDFSDNPFLAATDVLAKTGIGMDTPEGEKAKWKRMGLEIKKISVSAKTRQLRADYSIEIEKDMQAVHGLSARQILTEVISDEIVLELNQEFVRRLYHIALVGGQGFATPGVFDYVTGSDGRYSGERVLGMWMAIELEANRLQLLNRRGRGNFIVTSANVASMLGNVGIMKNDTDYQSSLNVDVMTNTYAGIVNGRTRVYVDPFLSHDGVLIGYKGVNEMDNGVFYCPYVPLTMYQGIDVTNDFKNSLGAQTRAGFVQNPIVPDSDKASDAWVKGKNYYYTKFAINNLKFGG